MTQTIIDCLNDEKLFAPFFRGESWHPWRAFLTALFALEMDDAGLATYRACTGRAEPPAVPFKEATLIVGRRGGKSRVLATIATFLATFFDYTPYLAPGEVATICVIAANRAQARSIFRYTSGLLNAVPFLAKKIKDETSEQIELNNRVVIEINTASFRVTRGYTFAAVLADETAFWRDETSANPDVEIFRAIRPGLSNIPGAILLNASSPYRKAGVLYSSYKRNYGRDDARVLVWKADTLTMNPHLDPSIVAEAFAEDPEAARAEYGAGFREDLADYVSREAAEACVQWGCHERPPNRDVVRRYTAFLDASAGNGSDSMTLAVAHAEGDVAMLDLLREWRPPFSPDDVVDEAVASLKAYGIVSAQADRWGGDWVAQSFRKRGITIAYSERPKSDIYKELLPLVTTRRCSLLDQPRLLAQLCGLERRTARGGRDSIDHSQGQHDDCINAAAGALVSVTSGAAPIKISDESMQAVRDLGKQLRLSGRRVIGTTF